MPKVSVIVPNYNHATYLQQRIDSILNQTYQDFELILLDDCSTDNSREVLNRYRHHPKVAQIIFNETNSGSTFRQWNKGIELATGEYIWIAESDDWADTFFLETITTELAKRNFVGLAYTASRLINSEGKVTYDNKFGNTGEVNEYTGKDFLTQKLLTSNAIWNASMMVFRKDLSYTLKDQSYSEMKYCGDWFFYVQLSQQTRILEIKLTLNNYRQHINSITAEAKKSGKYFTEGFHVFVYITKIRGVSVPLKSLYEWAKMYKKAEKEYQFSNALKKDILRMFRSYSSLINLFVEFRSLLYYVKNI